MVLGFVLIAVVGICDFLTGYEIGFSSFYVLPISFLTWFCGWRPGLLASLTSALVWLSMDQTWARIYSHPLIPAGNAFILFSLFAIITGKAAMVMRSKGCGGATSIHSMIYRPLGSDRWWCGRSGHVHRRDLGGALDRLRRRHVRQRLAPRLSRRVHRGRRRTQLQRRGKRCEPHSGS